MLGAGPGDPSLITVRALEILRRADVVLYDALVHEDLLNACDPAWMRRYLPWHYDHHLGRNQHANWCVTYPLADYVLGTREKWAETPNEAAALARIEARKRRAATPMPR